MPREGKNPVPAKLRQVGDWGAAQRAISGNASGMVGELPNVSAGPKHILRYFAEGDSGRANAVLGRFRHPVQPPQGLTLLVPNHSWWDSQPRTRIPAHPRGPAVWDRKGR